MAILSNKKILYIGPLFFNYDQKLVSKFKQLGGIIHTFELYPNSLYFNSIKKFRKSYYNSRFINNYYNKLLEFKDYDYVLIRHGFQLSNDLLLNLRKQNPNAFFINFHWDSIKSKYNYLPIIKHFDKVCSFDYQDCQTYNLCYLPLFFIDEYGDFSKKEKKGKKENDLLFIGGWRDLERYNLIKETEKLCKQNQLSFFYYLQLAYIGQFRFIRKGTFPKQAKHRLLTHAQILEYFDKSLSIIDFPSSFQSGLTMRTFETLGAGKKLITTNKNILNEPFYNPEYISVINPKNLKINVDFIKNEPKDKINVDNYSLESYIYKLLQTNYS
jgi:hypothetical protein